MLLLFDVCSSLFVVRCVLSVDGCLIYGSLLFVVCYLFCVMFYGCLFCALCYVWLFVVLCLLFVVRCLSFVVCCLVMLVVCCLL